MGFLKRLRNKKKGSQGDTIHAYKNLYLHCGPSTKVTAKLKSVDKNEDS